MNDEIDNDDEDNFTERSGQGVLDIVAIKKQGYVVKIVQDLIRYKRFSRTVRTN